MHVRHSTGVDAVNILVEVFRVVEHVTHGRHSAGAKAVDVLVEIRFLSEQLKHCRHGASVEGVDRTLLGHIRKVPVNFLFKGGGAVCVAALNAGRRLCGGSWLCGGLALP